MGTNKAFVRLNGKQLIDYALDILKEVTPHVILSVGSESFRYKNLPVVKDVYPGCGPIGGIYSALQYSNTDLNLVISCDLPFVPADLLKFLTEEARNDDADVTLFVDEHGYWQTLCAVYRKSILPQMEEAVIQKNLKLKMIVSEVKYRIIPVGKTHKYYQSNAFLNMNTPEDVFKQTKKQWL